MGCRLSLILSRPQRFGKGVLREGKGGGGQSLHVKKCNAIYVRTIKLVHVL